MLSYLRITKDLSGSYSLPVSSIAFFILVLLPISMIYSTTIAIQWIGVSIRLIEISSLFSDRILSCYDYACPQPYETTNGSCRCFVIEISVNLRIIPDREF